MASFTGLLHVPPFQIHVPPIAFSPPETTSVPFSDPMFVPVPAGGGFPGARVQVIPFHSQASDVLLKPPSSMQAVAACGGGMPVASDPPPLLEPDPEPPPLPEPDPELLPVSAPPSPGAPVDPPHADHRTKTGTASTDTIATAR